jgi:HPt (histidine-containing phosphotransfer) domain-containing protein
MAQINGTGANRLSTSSPEPGEVLDGDGDSAIIDREVLKGISKLGGETGDTELLKKILSSFINYSDSLFKQFHLNGDREEVVRLAHSLKSSSANIGALQLAELCKEMETACQSSNGLSPKLRSEVETEYWKVKGAITKILSDGI